MSDFQVLSASLPADKSTLEKSLVQTRKKMEMPRENNTRLEETKRELTTERDTLKAILTATNQSFDESNQHIDTLSSEVSSLLSQKTELERLLSKDWLTTTDTQTDWVGWSESAAKLASIEKFHLTIDPSHQPHYLDDIGDEIRSMLVSLTECVGKGRDWTLTDTITSKEWRRRWKNVVIADWLLVCEHEFDWVFPPATPSAFESEDVGMCCVADKFAFVGIDNSGREHWRLRFVLEFLLLPPVFLQHRTIHHSR
ncbi:hypothetical protein BLNAU_23100 [Blattamonas nauphoetae]|uniref:Uncharacterized protein n=1 Tax=Blattamonas nauphoetae TaxID=2049346 RepID=A0ABQ9WR56_9EUKA|nr:hypothetical protein BLNAU_23100 [Blattamonas nauphoetae]